jgi:hypothetical protein
MIRARNHALKKLIICLMEAAISAGRLMLTGINSSLGQHHIAPELLNALSIGTRRVPMRLSAHPRGWLQACDPVGNVCAA